MYIKTHDGESQGQEETAVHDDRVSYLHVPPHSNSQTNFLFVHLTHRNFDIFLSYVATI